MKIPVLVEHLAGGVYRANAGSLFPFTTEGATADEAVMRLKEKIMEQMTAGAHMVSLEVPTDNPWLAGLASSATTLLLMSGRMLSQKTVAATKPTFVTRNVRDFQRIPNLTVENWAL